MPFQREAIDTRRFFIHLNQASEASPLPWSQRFFFFFSDERAAKRRARVAKRRERKTSGYLGLESHFHADAGCQTRQIYNYKTDQWQVGNHVLINRPLGITNRTNQSA